MSFSNAYGKYYLPREVRSKLGQFQYRNSFKSSTVDSFKSLKDQILGGPVEIRILDTKRFKAEIGVSLFHEALCQRNFFGIRRVHRLCRAAEQLASEKWATAWTLTTCYYAAFFATLELLHVFGRHVSYFSPEEMIEVNVRSLPSQHSVDAGTYLGIAVFNSSSGEVEVNYSQTAQKPHEFVWNQLRELVQQTPGQTAEAVRHRETLLRILGASTKEWSRPNEIRNRWNYVDAALFCERGEAIGMSMNNRILNPKDAHRWGEAKHLAVSDENKAIGIAYLRAVLVEAADQVAQVVLPSDLSRKRLK